MLVHTPSGLYCPAGGFHIDPSGNADQAIVTHAHGDHARPGNRHYWTATPGLELVRQRLPRAAVEALDHGERRRFGTVTVSLHPAGHILGSAQVRIEADDGTVWVVSGDYKRGPDPTCAPFEPLSCDVFVTEATFASPIYRWPDIEQVTGEILDWWRANQAAGRTSVLYCYALGKCQRILAQLRDRAPGPVLLHENAVGLTAIYERAGCALAPSTPLSRSARRAPAPESLVLAPPGVAGGRWMRRLRNPATAFASGWLMTRRGRASRGHEAGFVISDHADWPALLATARATGASTVLVMHGETSRLCHALGAEGIDARPARTALAG